MKPYGPVAVTINTPFQIGIDKSATVVQVHNNTGLSLRLYFGAAAPASPTYPSQWHATIDPGAHPVLPINSSQWFDGTLSFYPYSVQGSTPGTPGVIGASSFVSVEAYFAGEQAPQSVYSPVFQQGAAQQRVVTLPAAGRPVNNTAPYSVANQPYIDQTSGTPLDIARVQVPATANVIGNTDTNINVFLHGLHAKFKSTAADTQTEIEFSLDVIHTTGAFVALTGPFTMFSSALSAAFHIAAPTTAYSDRIEFYPTAPLVYSIPIPGATGVSSGDYIILRFNLHNTLGVWRLFLNPIWHVDMTNRSVPAGYGGNDILNLATGAIPTGATNPRTY